VVAAVGRPVMSASGMHAGGVDLPAMRRPRTDSAKTTTADADTGSDASNLTAGAASGAGVPLGPMATTIMLGLPESSGSPLPGIPPAST
jgi:hypothetical protein